MVELETGWQPSTKLNVIAGDLDFTTVDPLPEGVTRDQIEEYCYALRDLYGDYVDELVSETALSQREAQAWALRNYVYEGQQRLSYEAVGLYIWAIGRATEGDPLSRTIVSKYYRRAEQKMRRAEETLKRRGPPPYPDDVYDEPALLWVEGEVGDRLRAHADPDETYSDLLERLVEEATESASLASLVETCRERLDSEYVAVETVRPDWDREVSLVVHAPSDGPDPAADADVLDVDGRTVEFAVEFRDDPRRERSHLPVFDAVADRESVPLEAGIGRLRDALGSAELDPPGLVERARESGAVALAVDDQPAGAGAHLYPVYPDDEVGEPFAYLERIALDDRTLSVGRVEPVTVEEYGEVEGATLLWASAAGPDGPRQLPEDPTERRERFPAAVLRTA